MTIYPIHAWKLSPTEAIQLQRRLKRQISPVNAFQKISEIRWVAGCDLALDLKRGKAFGGVIVYSFPDLEEVERRVAVQKISFPYVPGLLSFREGPILLKAIASLKHTPDLFIFDGQGIAHPRGIGIASHLALFLKKPTIGCAKSRLYGQYREPGLCRGDVSRLRSPEGKAIGSVVRTRDRVKPVFISPGHNIDVATAVRVILQCGDGFRIPKPTREADHYVEVCRRKAGSD